MNIAFYQPAIARMLRLSRSIGYDSNDLFEAWALMAHDLVGKGVENAHDLAADIVEATALSVARNGLPVDDVFRWICLVASG